MSKSEKEYQAIRDRIAARIGREPRIVYELDSDLDKVAFHGIVCFIEIRQSLHGFKDGKTDSVVYTSPVTHNPTFLDVAAYADEMLHVMGDEHHIFLARVDIIGTQYHDGSGIKFAGFSMES